MSNLVTFRRNLRKEFEDYISKQPEPRFPGPFGWLEPLEFDTHETGRRRRLGGHRSYWRCRCHYKGCGKIALVRANQLTCKTSDGRSISCGCKQFDNLEIRRHAKLANTETEFFKITGDRLRTRPAWIAKKSWDRINYWPAICKACGEKCIISTLTIWRGSKSCGCERVRKAKEWLRVAPRKCGHVMKAGPRIALGEPGGRPIVLGKEKKPLTREQYQVVKALIDAGPIIGLSKDELTTRSKTGDARNILRRLRDSDSDWAAVIHFAGVRGGGYRIG